MQEIDELVDEWTPDTLVSPLDDYEELELSNLPIIHDAVGPRPKLVNTGKTALNLTNYNFTGLAGDERITTRAIDALRKYGLGSCGPATFIGTLGIFVISYNMIISKYIHKTHILSLNKILRRSSGPRLLSSAHRRTQLYPLLSPLFVNAATSLSLTVVSILQFTREFRPLGPQCDGTITTT